MVVVISDFWQDVFNFKFINVKLVVYCAVVEIDFFSLFVWQVKLVGERMNLVFRSFARKGMKIMEMHQFSIQDQGNRLY